MNFVLNVTQKATSPQSLCCGNHAKANNGGAPRPTSQRRTDGISSTLASLSLRRPCERRRQRGGLTAARAIEDSEVPVSSGAENDEVANVVGENISHAQQIATNLHPQHDANSAVETVLQSASAPDMDIGWGYELHYLAHHPVHVALLVTAIAGMSFMMRRVREKIKNLKAEFLAQGVDLTNVDNRVDTLMYLKTAGMLPLGLEVCAMKQAETEVLFLGPEGVKKWQSYYAQRGIVIESSTDFDRVRKHVANLHHLEGCLLVVDKEAFTN